MAVAENQLIEQLKEVGNRLLQPPSSTADLLNLLDEVETLLSKVGQSPSKPVREALLLPMKALISDDLLGNSHADVKITVAACLNDFMRISAPVAPYDDDKMKEIFELIVLSFDKLSSLSGRCYTKAVSILENVAKLRSFLMMLDLDCDSLIVKMFKLFQKNISPDHPHSVFLAMETIMSAVIKESDAVSLELIKVLLASIRKENQNASLTSWKLGVKVFEECAEKLKPYVVTAMKSLDCRLEDYASILALICMDEPDTMKDLVDDSAKHVVYSESSADKSTPGVIVQCLEAIKRCNQNTVVKTKIKGSVNPGTDPGSRRGKKSDPCNPDGRENFSGKGRATLGSSHTHLKKSSLTSKNEKAMPALEDVVSKGETKEVADLEHKPLQQATPLGDSSNKRTRLPKKDVSAGSGIKNASGSSRKSKSQMNDASKLQRKRSFSDDEVLETPHGRKAYKEDLVGCRIKVWWPLDHRYYEGTISSYDASSKKHKVDYDDGDEEILNLWKESWEFLGEETPDDLDLLLAVKRTPQPPANVQQREDGKGASQNHTDD